LQDNELRHFSFLGGSKSGSLLKTDDLRLSLIVENWDIIPDAVRQSVFLQLAQFSFEKWREKS
jgi:hypothetical protein